jgi:hypothetical protein
LLLSDLLAGSKRLKITMVTLFGIMTPCRLSKLELVVLKAKSNISKQYTKH